MSPVEYREYREGDRVIAVKLGGGDMCYLPNVSVGDQGTVVGKVVYDAGREHPEQTRYRVLWDRFAHQIEAPIYHASYQNLAPVPPPPHPSRPIKRKLQL